MTDIGCQIDALNRCAALIGSGQDPADALDTLGDELEVCALFDEDDQDNEDD